MFELLCPVRKCANRLQRKSQSLVCSSGHCFDRSRDGYWNLTQPQDKKSSNPGDPTEAVMARHRWLERGFGETLADSLLPWLEHKSESPQRVIDLGCGEGYFGAALFRNGPFEFCGIDLSRKAVRLAARRWPEATWVLANADRQLPVPDGSVEVAISLFGRRPLGEISRILSADGVCVVAVPGKEDLIELRRVVQKTGVCRSRWESIVDQMSEAGFACIDRKQWEHAVSLDANAIADAMAMTYRGQRHSETGRLNAVKSMDVTLAADLMLFRRS